MSWIFIVPIETQIKNNPSNICSHVLFLSLNVRHFIWIILWKKKPFFYGCTITYKKFHFKTFYKNFGLASLNLIVPLGVWTALKKWFPWPSGLVKKREPSKDKGKSVFRGLLCSGTCGLHGLTEHCQAIIIKMNLYS